jgi:hypothetical protein
VAVVALAHQAQVTLAQAAQAAVLVVVQVVLLHQQAALLLLVVKGILAVIRLSVTAQEPVVAAQEPQVPIRLLVLTERLVAQVRLHQ